MVRLALQGKPANGPPLAFTLLDPEPENVELNILLSLLKCVTHVPEAGSPTRTPVRVDPVKFATTMDTPAACESYRS